MLYHNFLLALLPFSFWTELVQLIHHRLPTIWGATETHIPLHWSFTGSTPFHHLPPPPCHHTAPSYLHPYPYKTHHLLTYKALHQLASTYISGLLQEHSLTHPLCSTSTGIFSTPTSRLSTMGSQALSCSAARLWNYLLLHIKPSDSPIQIKTQNLPVPPGILTLTALI